MPLMWFLRGTINLLSMIGPPIICGPAAAVIFVALIKKKDKWQSFLFWALLAVAHLVALAIIALTFGHALFGPGYFACATLPGAAVISLIILLLASPKVWQMLAGNRQTRVHYIAGIVLIPLLQLIAALVFPAIQPKLCHWLAGLGLCC
jgi:hypothetical protein